MGSACTTPEMKEQAAVNKKIEKQIKKDEDDAIGEQKLLLLGTGECGKSTILKQMQILHKEGFSNQDRIALKEIVYSNIITSMHTVAKSREQFGYTYNQEQLDIDARYLTALVDSGKDTMPFTGEVFLALKRLWSDPITQKCFARRSEYQVGDSLHYFMGEIDRIYNNNYIPSPEDILHTRVPTAGIVQIAFPIKGTTFKVFDVGGQRSERRKWIHLFEDVNAIIYISAINEFDQTLYEDSKTNRMKESLDLFKHICNTRWFENSSIILFLNKRDLFEEKIKKTPINVFFKNYNGPNTYKDCMNYLRDYYLNLCEKKKTKKIYMHETCATDTSQVQVVIDSVIDTVIGKNLRGTGMD